MADYKNRLDEFLTRLGVDLKAPQRCVSGTHADEHPSMYRHNGEWWRCFSCNENFNIYHFAARRLGVGLDKKSFRAVSEFIEDTLGLPHPVHAKEKISVEMAGLDAELKNYIDNYGRGGFAAKFEKITFADQMLRDLDNSQVGVIAGAVMERFKNIPLAGDPKSEAVFSDYFCNNLYPHVIYTPESGFYIYNYEAGVFQTRLAEAAIFSLIRKTAKRIEGFDVSTSRRLAGILKLASLHPLVHKTEDAFDRDDFLLNARGEVFDLRTLESRPASPDAPMKMSASVRPKRMETPVFDKFIAQISNGDPAMAAHLLRYMGYALTGSTREQTFLDFFGSGKNGKSTFLEFMLYVFGTYAVTMPDDLVLDKNSQQKSECAAADLQGKRLAVSPDCGRGALNDSMIKRITGGDTIRARRLYRDSFEFIPKSKLIIGTNRKLRLRDTGESVKRRLRLVPFEFYAEEADKALPDKLKGEAEGALFKLIREAYDYLYTGGFPACARIDEASRQYFDEENPFSAFFKERLKFDPAFSVKTVDVWEAYKAWAEANDVKARMKRELAQELEGAGVRVLKNSNMVYSGVCLV